MCLIYVSRQSAPIEFSCPGTGRQSDSTPTIPQAYEGAATGRSSRVQVAHDIPLDDALLDTVRAQAAQDAEQPGPAARREGEHTRLSDRVSSDAWVICTMSRARDLPVALSYGGAHPMATAAALGTFLVGRNFLHGSR